MAAVPGADKQFVVVSRDVTAERETNAAERANATRLKSIVSSNSDVLWDIDLQNNKVWWSEGLQASFGYGADAQIGDSPQWRHEHIHPEDRQRVVESMRLSVEDGSPTWEADFRYRERTGDYLEVYDRGAILRRCPRRRSPFFRHHAGRHQAKFHGRDAPAIGWLLGHRVNNMLAVISGLFHQSMRASHDLPSLGAAFGGRLVALAAANAAMLRGGGDRAELAEIIGVQLSPYLSSGRLTINGASVLGASWDLSPSFARGQRTGHQCIEAWRCPASAAL